MRKLLFVFLACFSLVAFASEVGMVTALSGSAKIKDAKSATLVDLKPFVKLRAGDQITLGETARLQIAFFGQAGKKKGRLETWQGVGVIEIGEEAGKIVKGNLQPLVKDLPPILVQQLAAMPSEDGNYKTGMVRTRKVPRPLSMVEQDYADYRQSADASDISPELYLLSAYLEHKKFDKVEALLKQMSDKSPDDPQVKMLKTMYAKAIESVKSSEAKQ